MRLWNQHVFYAFTLKTYLVTLSSDVSTLSASDTASTTVCQNIAYNIKTYLVTLSASDTASTTVCQNIAYNIKTYLVTLSSDVSTLSASDTASNSLSKHSV